MNDIQTDLSDQALVTAIRANLCEFFRHLNRSFPETYFENSKFARWCASLEHPWFNGVLSSRLPEKEDEAFIEETMAYFREKRIAAFTWWMDPALQCADWQSVLAEYGFHYSDDTPGMAIDLAALDTTPTVDGLEIRVVNEEETLRTWAHIFTIGYGLPPEWEFSVYDLQMRLGMGFPMRNYLGYLNGEPIATSVLFFGAGVAGIYSVATLPAARGKGIGAALTVRPLNDAREMGYRIGVLQSSEMGYNVYKKIGFRHLCQIEHFYLALQ
jgi:ribosomal protein S18 acetylase RimI-like enzyme